MLQTWLRLLWTCFELICLLPNFGSPRDDIEQTIDYAIALGVRVRVFTSDQLAIVKETGRRLGLGNRMLGTSIHHMWLVQ